MFKRYGIPLLAVALSSCGLLEDAQDVILGEKGATQSLAFRTAQPDRDRHRHGFQYERNLPRRRARVRRQPRAAPRRVHRHRASLEGFTAVLRLSEAGGNSSVTSPAEVKVSSKRTTSVDVSYAKNP
ncbi:MAG: hypothetical protein HC933_04500 [Pleurocapsa sp. SU_196_0]|nr:hypothetical protein [Pleurocapsa sp. SU_196_0]